MSRLIKFRVWNDSSRKWVYPVLDISNSFSHAGCLFSQFTGLLDQNKKEIFEGDIVTVNDSRYEVYWGENESAWSIKQIEGDEIDDYPLWLLWQAFDREYEVHVIGNIYDQPIV